jgi:hypothetical protein
MKSAVLLVAVFAIGVGTVGLVSPESLIAVGRYVATPIGLYAIGVLRVGIGLLLMLAAPVSRAPKTLRALGALVIVAGVTTPLFGVDRTRAILEWEAMQGPALQRAVAALPLAAGCFIAFAVAGSRRPRSGAGGAATA